MKKFFIAFACLFLAIPTGIFAQVKSYVGIVRQQYYQEYIDLFKSMSKELKDEGYNTYSKAIDSYLEGGFGSGFVWVAADGTNYIITNRHVVANAKSASVEFEDAESGEITKYEGLKVLATSDDIDIAILAFKDGEKPFKKGLEFSEKALTDGQEVWSAGYPGLGNEPVWQFGKGTVTNSRAKIKELLDPEISTIVQHSAQVDSGNSGGPLLIASGKDYLVAGINTWKAAYRDSTNFAIPATVIKKMIEGLSSGDTASAEDRALKMAKALGDSSQNFTSIVNFISYHKASVDGQKDFESVLRFAPTSVRSQISEAFSYNPAEGLRYACAYQLFKKYGSTEDKTFSYKTSIKEALDEKCTILFSSGEGEDLKEFETLWIKEHGLWRLDTSTSEEAKDDNKEENKKKEKKSGGAISFDGIFSPESIVIKGAFEFPLDKQDKTFGGEVQFFAAPTFGLALGAYKISNGFDSKFGFQMAGILRVPLDFTKFILTPYLEAGPSAAGMASHSPLINFFYEAGLACTLEVGSTVYPGFGVAFRGRKFVKFMDSTFEGNLSSVLVYVSLGF